MESEKARKKEDIIMEEEKKRKKQSEVDRRGRNKESNMPEKATKSR